MANHPDDVSSWGMDETGRVIDSYLLRNFTEDHPEWKDIAGIHLSYESSILAWDNDAPTPDNWAGITIHAEDSGEYGDWGITITDKDGNSYEEHLGDLYDLAWDFYDGADWYDYDVEKDINTPGGGSGE